MALNSFSVLMCR